jgi:hypothetical protein
MFTHIVFFKLNDGTLENVKKAADILEAMKGEIPQLNEIEVGIDVLHTDRSYDLSLITKFNSKEDMDAYQIHPYHVNEVLKYIKPMIKASATVDYQV